MKVICLLLLALGCAQVRAADFAIGDSAPDFELGTNTWNTPQGFSRLSNYRGKVVLVEVWATY
ncbi:MAG: hypothetical protein IPK87_15795 [Planctomycetes bacterium]|nr:hypothetical protein [Planctomycetota bacterium]